jgi:hypothetical protein
MESTNNQFANTGYNQFGVMINSQNTFRLINIDDKPGITDHKNCIKEIFYLLECFAKIINDKPEFLGDHKSRYTLNRSQISCIIQNKTNEIITEIRKLRLFPDKFLQEDKVKIQNLFRVIFSFISQDIRISKVDIRYFNPLFLNTIPLSDMSCFMRTCKSYYDIFNPPFTKKYELEKPLLIEKRKERLIREAQDAYRAELQREWEARTRPMSRNGLVR